MPEPTTAIAGLGAGLGFLSNRDTRRSNEALAQQQMALANRPAAVSWNQSEFIQPTMPNRADYTARS